MMRKSVLSWVVVGVLVAAGGSLAAAAPRRRVVTVPRVVGKEVTAAYVRLHDAGLRVTIRHGWAFSLREHGRLIFPETVVRTVPSPGTAIRSGSAVRVVLRCDCRGGHVSEPTHQPVYTVPGLAGRSATASYDWVRSKVLFFDAHLGPLRAGNAGTLLANYRVMRQWPGINFQLRAFNRDGKETPLTVWADQYG